MAKIGVLNPTYAPITAETENAPITYGAAKTFAHAITVGVTYQKNDTPLYGDNTIIENDTSVTGAEVTVGVDDVPEEDQVALFGVAEGDDGGYEINDTSAPYVGYGHIEVRKKDNVVTYLGKWFRKVQFGLPDESVETKKDKLAWQTSTMKGKAMGVYVDTTGGLKFAEFKSFSTLAEALTWLKGKGGSATPSDE